MSFGDGPAMAVNVCDSLALCARREPELWSGAVAFQDFDSEFPGGCAGFDVFEGKELAELRRADFD